MPEAAPDVEYVQVTLDAHNLCVAARPFRSGGCRYTPCASSAEVPFLRLDAAHVCEGVVGAATASSASAAAGGACADAAFELSRHAGWEAGRCTATGEAATRELGDMVKALDLRKAGGGGVGVSSTVVGFRRVPHAASVVLPPLQAGEALGAVLSGDLAVLAVTRGSAAARCGLGGYSGGLWRVCGVDGVAVADEAELLRCLASAAAAAAGAGAAGGAGGRACVVALAMVSSDTVRVAVPSQCGAEELPSQRRLLQLFSRVGKVLSVLPLAEAEEEPASSASAAAAAAAAVEPKEEAEAELCGECAAEVGDDDVFCGGCGARMRAAPEASSSSSAALPAPLRLFETYVVFASRREAERCVSGLNHRGLEGCPGATLVYEHALPRAEKEREAAKGAAAGAEPAPCGGSEVPLAAMVHRFGFFNPYYVLGVAADASDEGVRRAFNDRALRWHPDKAAAATAAAEADTEGQPQGGAGVTARRVTAEETKQLFLWAKEARDVLLDEAARAELRRAVDAAVAKYGARAVRAVVPKTTRAAQPTPPAPAQEVDVPNVVQDPDEEGQNGKGRNRYQQWGKGKKGGGKGHGAGQRGGRSSMKANFASFNPRR